MTQIKNKDDSESNFCESSTVISQNGNIIFIYSISYNDIGMFGFYNIFCSYFLFLILGSKMLSYFYYVP